MRIAIIEDEKNAAETLGSYLTQYGNETGIAFSVDLFGDAENFLTAYEPVYDIVFMDIELPSMNGMDAAARLREKDKQAVLIFVTNLVQFAVQGYSVDAMDFIVKPVSYAGFKLKMKKAIGLVTAKSGQTISIQHSGGLKRISTKDIYFIEVIGHKLRFHMAVEVIESWGSLTEFEIMLKPQNFLRCNRCYIVNPFYIASVDKMNINMKNGSTLQISHPQKRTFMSELAGWIGKGNK